MDTDSGNLPGAAACFEDSSSESAKFTASNFRSVQLSSSNDLASHMNSTNDDTQVSNDTEVLTLSSKLESSQQPHLSQPQEEQCPNGQTSTPNYANTSDTTPSSSLASLDWTFLREGKIFGRETELQALRKAFGRTTNSSNNHETLTRDRPRPELVLVSGKSGTGKTQLVKRALLPDDDDAIPSSCKRYVLRGKFDQQSIVAEPYGAFVAALTQLAIAMMEENDKDNVHRSLEENGDLGKIKKNNQTPAPLSYQEEIQVGVGLESCHVLCDLVPALGRVLLPKSYNTRSDGIMDPAEQQKERQAKEAATQRDAQQDRLNVALIKLFQVICHSSSSPRAVVLVLDDLQWCDSSSLKLLEDLIEVTTMASFTVVGICRDNEVSWHHGFADMLRRLEDEKNTSIVHIQVTPLSLEATNELVSHVLNQPLPICQPLARIIHEKSDHGNPFYMLQLLKSLYQEGVLVAQQQEDNDSDASTNQWLWDDKRWDDLVARNTNLDVMEMVSSQILRLPEECQKMLKIASCLGAEVESDILTMILDKESNDMRQLLTIATEECMLVERLPELPGRYQFAHDRVQEAAYSLIPAEEQSMAHLSIGRKLLQNLTSNELDENLFVVVNQLIGGIPLLTAEIDKTGLAEMCLRAGKKASQASDFEATRQYIEVATSLLPFRHWRDEYQLSLDIFSSKAEAECCAGNFDGMDKAIEAVVTNSRSLNDGMRAKMTKIYSLGLRSQFHDAIQLGREVLASLGETLPATVNLLYLIRQDLKVKRRLRSSSVDEIVKMPPLDNREKMSAMSVLSLMPPYVFCAQPEIFPFVSILMVKLTLKYGISDFSGPAFCYYAVGCIVMNDFESGYKYGKLALQLLERCEGPLCKVSPRLIFHVYGVTFHWKRPVKSTFPALRAEIPVAIAGGDFECAEIIAYTLIYVEYAAGTNLVALDRLIKEYLELKMSPESPWLKMIMLKKQMVDNLMGKTADPLAFILPENIDPTSGAQTDFVCFNCWVHTIKLQLGYHFGDIDMAMIGGKASRVGESVAKTSYYITFQLFYDGMACLEKAQVSDKRKHMAVAKKIIKRMKFLAKECPENILHKLYILEAELCALKGKLEMALSWYDQAVDHAIQQGVTQLQALAQERASVALRRLGKSTSKRKDSAQFMKQAISTYDRWGAAAIVTHLQKTLQEMEG